MTATETAQDETVVSTGFTEQHQMFRQMVGRFVQEEICAPLGITDLWLGIPEGIDDRIAELADLPPLVPATGLAARAIPPDLPTSQRIFGRPDVRRSCHPGAGGSTGWADPGLGIGVAVLKNRMLPSVVASSGHLLTVRDAIYEALGA